MVLKLITLQLVNLFVRNSSLNSDIRACKDYALKMPECNRVLASTNPIIERIPVDRLLYPHMVLVGFGNSSANEWKCGGSLIHESWILTAAHCLEDSLSGPAQRLRIGIATFEFDESEDLIQDRNISMRVRHPKYIPPSKYNDIALLKSDKPFALSRDIRIACLPSTDKFDRRKNLTVIGFGTTTSGAHKGSHTLMKVDVDLVDSIDCNKSMESLIKMGTLNRGITKGQFCAGDMEKGGRDTCQGDSGGPLQITFKDPDCVKTFPLPTLVGVTSFGRHCGFKQSPGVYTLVYHYIDWIEEVLWPTGKLRLIPIPALNYDVTNKTFETFDDPNDLDDKNDCIGSNCGTIQSVIESLGTTEVHTNLKSNDKVIQSLKEQHEDATNDRIDIIEKLRDKHRITDNTADLNSRDNVIKQLRNKAENSGTKNDFNNRDSVVDMLRKSHLVNNNNVGR